MLKLHTKLVVKDRGWKQLEKNIRDLFLGPSVKKFKEETFQRLNKGKK